MEWKEGPIPCDGEDYVIAVPWINRTDRRTRYELMVANYDEESYTDGTRDDIWSSGPEDVGLHLKLPELPQQPLWKEGPIPCDGKLYVVAIPWTRYDYEGFNRTYYELLVASYDDDSYTDGKGDDIWDTSPTDVEFYLEIPALPQLTNLVEEL